MHSENGMTLVEIMVSMVISSFVIAGVYGVYTIQQRSYAVQEQVAEMQQRIRSAMDLMTRYIRMTGYNPDNELACSTEKIVTAQYEEVVFNICNMEDADDYTIKIEFDDNTDKLSLTEDKDMNGTGSTLPIAEDVEVFELRYLSGYDDNGDPVVIPAPVTDKDTRKKIKAVQISMLIRSTAPDQKHTDSLQYTMPSGSTWGPTDYKKYEHHHRRLFSTTIQLRNML
jgi:type IV pilus assembly protein PilW